MIIILRSITNSGDDDMYVVNFFGAMERCRIHIVATSQTDSQFTSELVVL